MSSLCGPTIVGKRASAPRRCPACRRPTASSGSRRRAACRGLGAASSASRCTSAMFSTRMTAPFGQLAERADHLGMAGMADQDDRVAAPEMQLGLAMDLGDQRAGRVDGERSCASARFGRHRLRHAMGREDHRARRSSGSRRVPRRRWRPSSSGSRPRICCARSRAGRRRADHRSSAPARPRRWRGSRRRRSRAERRAGSAAAACRRCPGRARGSRFRRSCGGCGEGGALLSTGVTHEPGRKRDAEAPCSTIAAGLGPRRLKGAGGR